MTKQLGLTSARKGEQRHGWHLVAGATITPAVNNFSINVTQLLLPPDFRDLRLFLYNAELLISQAASFTPLSWQMQLGTDGTTVSSATSFVYYVNSYYSSGGAAVDAPFSATDLLRFFGSATVPLGGSTSPGQPGMNLNILFPDFQSTGYKSINWNLEAMGTASAAIFADGRGKWLQGSPLGSVHIFTNGTNQFSDGHWELWGLKGFTPNF